MFTWSYPPSRTSSKELRTLLNPGFAPATLPISPESMALWCIMFILCLASSNRTFIRSELAACRLGSGISNSRLLRLD
jgi:hypothetical protein